MRRPRPRRRRFGVSTGIFLTLLAVTLTLPQSGPEARQAEAARPDLVSIFEDVRKLREPRIVDGIPDYSAAAVETQKQEFRALRSRFDALDPTSWPVRDQVDYLLVRSELDMLD